MRSLFYYNFITFAPMNDSIPEQNCVQLRAATKRGEQGANSSWQIFCPLAFSTDFAYENSASTQKIISILSLMLDVTIVFLPTLDDLKLLARSASHDLPPC